MIWLLLTIPGWFVMSIGVAALLGKGIRIADEAQADDVLDDSSDDHLCALVQPESWSQAAIDEAFQQMAPSFVTEDSFELDAEINRQSRDMW